MNRSQKDPAPFVLSREDCLQGADRQVNKIQLKETTAFLRQM